MVDRTRLTEQKELDWWTRRGFIGERAWKQAKYVGPGRVITIPRDFFGKYDLNIIHPKRNCFVGIQVSVSGLRKSRSTHGPPLFAWTPPAVSIEAWVSSPSPGVFHVLASYHDGTVEREWWRTSVKSRARNTKVVK